MDEIQHTYKLCKTCFDSIYSWKLKIWSWKFKTIKPKRINFWTCVCVNLSKSRLTVLTQVLNKIKTNLTRSLLVDLHLQDDSIQIRSKWAWLHLSARCDLERELLNHHVLASKLDFESFIEAKHLLRSWSISETY